MKKGGKIVLILAIAAVIGLVVFLIIRKKRSNASANNKVRHATDEGDSSEVAAAPVAPTSPSIGTGTLATIASNIGNVFSGGENLTYDSNERSITVNGTKYVFPSRAKVKEVQQNLIEGFTSLAENTSDALKKAEYNGLVAAIKAAGGVDGLVGKATAKAFAKAAELMPSVVKVYKV